jgi:DNA-binding transcriptional MocR family regulator
MSQDSGSSAVTSALRALIAANPPGSQLPSTRTMQERYRVSALTMRHVLADLAGEGLLVTHPGRGTFTAAPTSRTALPAPGDPGWQTSALGSRPGLPDGLERLLAPSAAGAVALGSTFLDASLQPLGLLAAATTRAARQPGAWDRPPAGGLPALRAHLAVGTGPGYGEQNVLITPGGQSAITTAFRALVGPGEPVILESPVYPGAFAAARAAGLHIVPVPTDADGVLPDALADALIRTKARLVYLQTRHANPTGAVLAPDRREPVLRALGRARAFCLEDDWVRELDLDGPTPPPLASMDSDGHVLYLRSLTKPVAAGLRVAGLAASGPVLARLRRARFTEDLFVSPVLQRAALDLLTAPGWERHLQLLRKTLLERRNTLLAAVATELPGATTSRPGGGLHIWLRLPDGLDDRSVAEQAERVGVVVSPGSDYFPGEPIGPFLRLSFAAATPTEITVGIRLLRTVVAP